MPVNLQAPDPKSLHPVPGVKLGIAMAGVRRANRRDLGNGEHGLPGATSLGFIETKVG